MRPRIGLRLAARTEATAARCGVALTEWKAMTRAQRKAAKRKAAKREATERGPWTVPASPFDDLPDPCHACGDPKAWHRGGRCEGDFLCCDCKTWVPAR
jgi:hypothetical protein